MLKGKKRTYPYTVWTTKPVPRPDTIDPKRYGHFMRVPTKDLAVWGFEDEHGMGLFSIDYAEHIRQRPV